MEGDDPRLSEAARAIAAARAILVTAGAGMGVDSGLPDFRGSHGFWAAYPPYAKLGLSFVRLASPDWFDRDPELAWGFYGHRLHLYRETQPHVGFATIKRWCASAPAGGFVLTSNVDGQFQRAGFASERILELHGTIHHLQCLRGCGQPLFAAAGVEVVVEPETMRARPPLPRCPGCKGLARPNILMFGDGGWDSERSDAQAAAFERWLGDLGRTVRSGLVILEWGAGLAVPTVRHWGESLRRQLGACLIRINPRDALTGSSDIALPVTAALAACGIERHLAQWRPDSLDPDAGPSP